MNCVEYQCGIKPFGRYKSSADLNMMNEDNYKTYLAEAIENDSVLVGPIITPHIIISSFNEKAKNEECLGYSQISISSVLSGHGNISKKWVKLSYATGESGKLLPAGEILVKSPYNLFF